DGSTKDSSVKTRLAHASQALLLVNPLVITDLTKQVRERRDLGVVLGEGALEWLRCPFRMLGDEGHVFVFGMILKVGVELVTPRRPQHIQQPRKLVVREGQDLRDDPKAEPTFATALAHNALLKDEQVPLLVVLLGSRF